MNATYADFKSILLPLPFEEEPICLKNLNEGSKRNCSIPLPSNPYEQSTSNPSLNSWTSKKISDLNESIKTDELTPDVSLADRTLLSSEKELHHEDLAYEETVDSSDEEGWTPVSSVDSSDEEGWTPVSSVKQTEAKRKRTVTKQKTAKKQKNLGHVNSFWTKEEDTKLVAAVNEWGTENWIRIADEIEIGRDRKQCRSRWLYHLDPTRCNDEWSELEEGIIINEVKRGNRKWSKIKEMIESQCQKKRTCLAIKNYWNFTLKKNDNLEELQKKKMDAKIRAVITNYSTWNREEDDKLVAAVNRLGPSKWKMIAETVGTGRNAKQCRDRWLHHLDPECCREEWSEQENQLILKEIEKGNKSWSKIAKKIYKKLNRKRVDNDIKNYWHTKSNNIMNLNKKETNAERSSHFFAKRKFKGKSRLSQKEKIISQQETSLLKTSNFISPSTDPHELPFNDGLFDVNAFGDLFGNDERIFLQDKGGS